MGTPLPIVVDRLQGEARLGLVSVAIASAGSNDELQVGGAAGPVLRPLTFLERSRAAHHALNSPNSLDALCTQVVQAATVRPGTVDRLVQEILALFLSGAAQDAPLFTETERLLIQTAGWSLTQLADTPAVEVDRLAIQLSDSGQSSSWTSFVLVNDAPDDLPTLRADLAERLLGRAIASPALIAPSDSVLPPETALGAPIWDKTIRFPLAPLHSTVSGSAAVSSAATESGLTANRQGMTPSATVPPTALDPLDISPPDVKQLEENPRGLLPADRWISQPFGENDLPGENPRQVTPVGDGADGQMGARQETLNTRQAGDRPRQKPTTHPIPSSIPTPSSSSPTPSPALRPVALRQWRMQPAARPVTGSIPTPEPLLGSAPASPFPPPLAHPTAPLDSFLSTAPQEAVLPESFALPLGTWGGDRPPMSDPNRPLVGDLADALAELLHQEADLRGIER